MAGKGKASGERQRHDPLFRLLAEHAERLDRFFRAVLPAAWLARAAAEPFALAHGSYTTGDLDTRQADLVVRARTRAHGDPVYVVAEHKSRNDPKAPGQAAGYCAMHRHRHAKEERAGAGRRALPFATGLIVHHGARAWSPPYAARTDAADMERRLEAACALDMLLLLHFDLRRPGGASFADPGLRMWAAAYALPEKVTDAALRGLVRSLVEGDDWLRPVMRYTIVKLRTKPERVRAAVRMERPQDEEWIMEAWEIEMESDVARKIFLKMLEHRFGPLSEADQAKVVINGVRDQDAWMKLAMDAKSLGEVLRTGQAKK